MKRLSIILTIITFFFTAPAIAITTSDIIKKYGHQTVQDFIRKYRDGFITIEVGKGHLIQKTGSQSKEFITLKSINDDFRRIGISAKQADRMISEYTKQKKAEYVAQKLHRAKLERRERKRREQEQERIKQENIKKEKERREQHEEAKRTYLKSESYTDKLKRRLSPVSYWQSKVKKYEELIKETKASLRDSYMEMEKLKLTKDIELRQAVNLAKLVGSDPRQARREAFEEYKLLIQNIGENIRIEQIILNECYSYLSVATTEIKDIQTSVAYLQSVANQYNAETPKKLDSYTILLGIIAKPAELVYRYRIINIKIDKKSLETFMSMQTPVVINHMCSTPETRWLINNGVTLTSAYYDENNHFFGRVKVTNSSCN